MAVIGLGISLVTSGMGAGLLGLTGTMGQIASNAFTSIVTKASISLVNNQGNLGKVFEELGSSSYLRSLGIMVASAGICGKLGLPVQPQGFEQHLKTTLVGTGPLGCLVDIIRGKDAKEAILESLRTTIAHTLGSMIAHEIGEQYHNGKMDGFTHKGSHFFLGGGVGMLLSKKPFEGFLPGALGSVASECIAEMLSPGDLNSVVSKTYAKGKGLSDQEMAELYKQELTTYREEIKTNAKWAKFGAGIIALASGLNEEGINNAIATAKISIDNNNLGIIARALSVGSIEGLTVVNGTLILGGLSYMAKNGVNGSSLLLLPIEIQQKLLNKGGDDGLEGKEDIKENSGNRSGSKSSSGNFDPENEDGDEKPRIKPRPSEEVLKDKREDWMKDNRLTSKQKGELKEVNIYGKNPGNVKQEFKQGQLKLEVDTELPNGEIGAREFFKRLTGKEVPLNESKFKVEIEGHTYQFRVEGKSGHPKVEIKDSITNPKKTILEKITFK